MIYCNGKYYDLIEEVETKKVLPTMYKHGITKIVHLKKGRKEFKAYYNECKFIDIVRVR